MHLFLAFFWFVVGAGILLAPLVLDAEGPLRFNASYRTIMGVFALFLCGYNLLRWRLERLRQRYTQDAVPEPRDRRREVVNPEFDFTDEEKPKNRWEERG